MYYIVFTFLIVLFSLQAITMEQSEENPSQKIRVFSNVGSLPDTDKLGFELLFDHKRLYYQLSEETRKEILALPQKRGYFYQD